MSRGIFDIKDASGGVLYVFNGKNVSGLPFSIDSSFNIAISGATKIPELDTVFLSLPLQLLDFRIIEFPFSDPAKIRQAMPFELDGVILKGTNRVAFDMLPGPQNAPEPGAAKGEPGRKALAVYAEKKLLHGLISSLKALGAEPSVITSIELGHAVSSGLSSFQNLIPALAGEAPLPEKEQRQAAALREFENPVINLRRGDMAYTKEKEEFGRSLKKTVMLSAALVLLLSFKSGIMAVVYNRQARAIENQIALSYKKNFPGSHVSGGAASLYALRSAITEMQRKQSQIGGISALETLKNLTSNKVNNVTYNDIHMEESGITVKGNAKSLDDVDAAKKALSKVYSVNITETSNSSAGVSFTMRIK